MSGQAFRWGVAFAATLSVSSMIVVSALNGPSPAAGAAALLPRDPSSIGEVERELILNQIREGDLRSQNGDPAGALRAWEEARRRGEGLWPIHEGLGDSYARAGLLVQAVREYEKAEALLGDRRDALRSAIVAKRADALLAGDQPLGALEAYLSLPEPEIYRGRILRAVQSAADPAEAIRRIERRAQIYNPRLYRILAEIRSRRGEAAEADQASAQAAIQASPWDEGRNRSLVEWLKTAGRLELALEVCRAWVKAVPRSIEGYAQMGAVLDQAGRSREALVAYTSMIDVGPADPAAYRRLGEVFLERRRLEDALAQFEQGLRLSPQDAELRSLVVSRLLAKVELQKSEGKLDECRATRRRLADLGVPEAGLFDLKVVMTWDALSDVDLDVIEPGGTRIYHGNRNSKVGGVYSADNTKGLGPESYTVARLRPGTWRVGAHLHSGPRSVVKFVVILYEDSPRETRREESLTLDTAGDQTTFIHDVVVGP